VGGRKLKLKLGVTYRRGMEEEEEVVVVVVVVEVQRW